MNKLYGRLAGRCRYHGMNKFGGGGKVCFNRQKHICEVAAECNASRKSKYSKRYMRRQARRRDWELP